MTVHAIGERANALLLDIYDSVAQAHGAARPALPDRARAAPPAARTSGGWRRSGVIASMQPYHAIDDGRWAEKRIGPERIKTTYAFRSLLDAGARLAFGSDWTVAPLDPILGIYAAVTRRTLDGKNPNGWVPEQKITVEEALRAYTSGQCLCRVCRAEPGQAGSWIRGRCRAARPGSDCDSARGNRKGTSAGDGGRGQGRISPAVVARSKAQEGQGGRLARLTFPGQLSLERWLMLNCDPDLEPHGHTHFGPHQKLPQAGKG